MQKMQFSIDIAAPKEKVWRLMLDDATYREWTSAFAQGSYAVTDWQTGSEAKFLVEAGDGPQQGMISRIAEHRPNAYLSIEHLGVAGADGQLMSPAPGEEAWAGAKENYTITDSGGVSHLAIDIDVTDTHRDYMNETWPRALAKLKEISER